MVETALVEAERFRAAGDDVILDLLIVRETEELARVGQRVGDIGFLGLSAQQDVIEALGAEHDRMANIIADRILESAHTANIPVARTQVEGTFAESVLETAEQHQSDLILLTRSDRPFISRILFGSEADTVAKMARREGLGRVIIEG